MQLSDTRVIRAGRFGLFHHRVSLEWFSLFLCLEERSGHFSNRISNSFIFPISRYFSGPVQSNFIYFLHSGNIQIFRRPYTRRRKPFVSFLWRSVCWIQTSRAQVGYSICRWSCRESVVIKKKSISEFIEIDCTCICDLKELNGHLGNSWIDSCRMFLTCSTLLSRCLSRMDILMSLLTFC